MTNLKPHNIHLIESRLVVVARLIVCVTFIFSGFIKAIDPWGMAYKLDAYLNYFGWQEWAGGYRTLMVSGVMAATEFLLGIYLLFGIRRRFTTGLLLLLMMAFTPFTLYLALVNPVADCGCFGDAWVLTNWQTFYKNVLLLGCACLLFMERKKISMLVSNSVHWAYSLYSMIYIGMICLMSLYYLPLLDFRPYKVGNNLLKAWQPTSEGGETTYRYIMSKDGVERAFTLENYPDSTWSFVRREQTSSDEADTKAPLDLMVWNEAGEDLTLDLLADTTIQFWVVSPVLEKASGDVTDELNTIHDFCMDKGYRMVGLTASDSTAIEDWRYRTGAVYPIYHADELVLKTMVRSNPGLILMKDGVVLHKWSSYNLPLLYEDDKTSEQILRESILAESGNKVLLKIILAYLIPLLFITLALRFRETRKRACKKTKQQHIKNNIIMRKKIVAGNWKMNTTLQDGVALATAVNDSLKADQPNCEVVICTPFIHLATVNGLLDKNLVKLGAENCADKASGAYTGEVSAEMVKSTGAEYVILGHSERRAYYNETPEILKEKVNLALANNLDVIFCIGEVLEEREANQQNAVVGKQLADSLFDLTTEQLSHIVLAYEPVWAIGTGKTATAEQAEEMHAFIRQTIADKFGAEAADNISILYGGSCKPSNAKEIFSKPDVDGGLIGGAALKADSFKGIIDAWK